MQEVQAFHKESLAGEYYEGFNVNSTNWTEKSEGTELWISEIDRLFGKCASVSNKGHLGKKISEIKVADSRWARKHWITLSNAYAKADHFKKYIDLFEEIYLQKAGKLEYLSEINFLFLTEINRLLGITTQIRRSSEFAIGEGKSERLVNICMLAAYQSGNQ